MFCGKGFVEYFCSQHYFVIFIANVVARALTLTNALSALFRHWLTFRTHPLVYRFMTARTSSTSLGTRALH